VKLKIHKYIITTFCTHEIYTLAVREHHRLRAFENRAMRLFGYKKEELQERWRTFKGKEFCGFKIKYRFS
jgi:hypothetical protein